MATAKKGIIDRAMKSKPVKATKDMIGDVVGAAAEAFMNPPMALDLPKKPARRASTKSSAKKAVRKKGTAAKSMDRTLVSTMEDYEVKYLAQKHRVTQKAVKEAVAKVGPSRNKVESELKAGKA